MCIRDSYIRMEVSDGLLQQLKTQLNELSGLVNTAANHAEGGSNENASRLNSMSGYVDNAANELNLSLIHILSSTARLVTSYRSRRAKRRSKTA